MKKVRLTWWQEFPSLYSSLLRRETETQGETEKGMEWSTGKGIKEERKWKFALWQRIKWGMRIFALLLATLCFLSAHHENNILRVSIQSLLPPRQLWWMPPFTIIPCFRILSSKYFLHKSCYPYIYLQHNAEEQKTLERSLPTFKSQFCYISDPGKNN